MLDLFARNIRFVVKKQVLQHASHEPSQWTEMRVREKFNDKRTQPEHV